MKDNMLVFTCLGLLLHWMLPVTSTKLDKADNIADDMYFKCSKTMANQVGTKIFEEEMKDETFSRVWKNAENCANNKMNQRADTALTKDHLKAICVYTAGGKFEFYKTFKEAVKAGGNTFRYHSLHFLLSSAIKILKDNQPQCYHTYHRTKLTSTGNVNDIIRFGYFASSSFDKTLTQFGVETCFCVYTCYGADLKKYPTLGDTEKEVLIPPYEMFKITAKDSPDCVPDDCKVRYTVESAGILSYQNCKKARP